MDCQTVAGAPLDLTAAPHGVGTNTTGQAEAPACSDPQVTLLGQQVFDSDGARSALTHLLREPPSRRADVSRIGGGVLAGSLSIGHALQLAASLSP